MEQCDNRRETAKELFAANFKKLRKQRNLTRKQMANTLSVSLSTITMWENAERETDFDTLTSIANLFDVSIDFLLGRAIKEQENKKWITDDGKVIGYIVLY